MHSLRLKQRVLEVQSKVFRRRHTSDPTSPTGQRPKLLVDENSPSPKTIKKTPSIVSLASSKLSRKSTSKRNKGAVEEAKGEKDGKERNRKSWRMRECELEADSKTLVDQKVEHPSVSAASPTIDIPIAPKAPADLHLDTSQLPDKDPHGLLTNSNPGSPHSPNTPITILETTSAAPDSPSSSATAINLATPTTSPIPPRPNLSTLASLRESYTDNSLPPTPASVPAPTHPPASSTTPRRPSQPTRRQSLLPANETNLIHNLLNPDKPPLAERYPARESQSGSDDHISQSSEKPEMVTRKIWVKRPTGSPTAVAVTEGDMVDDVRDLILKKYQNSLGKSYDAPDIRLRIMPRGAQRPRSLDHARGERELDPEELIVRALEEYYPNGQTSDEALIIDVPQRRTPRPSPSQAQSYTYGAVDHIGMEGNDYFSVPISTGHSQGTPVAGTSSVLNQPSMAVLTTGQVPQIPGSPGRRNHGRPILGRRMNTSSPTIHGTPGTQGPVMLMPRQSRARGTTDQSNAGQPPSAPPSQQAGSEDSQKVATPPPVRIGSPPTSAKPFKKEKKQSSSAPLYTDGAVPPIKVLIVEDNVINLRLLEAFMKRLKVRWESAMNGKIAVDKWRAGGFHLVLMDIQLPVMNGLDATKEIRRLERVNKIGSFPHTKLLDGTEEPIPDEIPENDKLPQSILLRSPVIIVALTASSLQSDRHEAYAAGCNDFLTKPVNFIWLERKVTEWGCMQALIDFDGWKKWKDNPDNHGGPGNSDGKLGKNKRLMAKSTGRKDKIMEASGKQIPTVG